MVKMAKQNKRFIIAAILGSLMQAVTEGASLGLLFIALELINKSSSRGMDHVQLTQVPTYAKQWISTNGLTGLIAVLAAIIIVQALQGASKYINGISVEFFAAACKEKVINIVHSRLLNLSYMSSLKIRTGSLIAVTTEGPEAIKQQIEELASLVVAIFLLCTYLLVLIKLSPWLLLLSAGLAGLFLTVQILPLKKIKFYSTMISEQQSLINSSLADDTRALKLLQATGNIQHPKTRMAKMSGELKHYLRKKSLIGQINQPATQFLGVVAITIVIGAGATIFSERQSGVIASLATFVIALQRLSGKLTQIGQITTTLAGNEGRLGLLDNFLSGKDLQIRRNSSKIQLTAKCPASIEFAKVYFTYPGSQALTLDSVNLKMSSGQIIGIVGASGSGKTTIVDLICNLISPTNGEILIDGNNLQKIDAIDWQKQIGLVSQDAYIFHGTIRENLCLNSNIIDCDRCLACLEEVNLGSLLSRLPYGLETVIGEGGLQLSGGQRQRLTIARALYSKARLIILDEATSSLDVKNEQMIRKLTSQLRGKATVLIVAHRLQTVQDVDCIYVMDKGKIIESGSHNELISANGVFSDLWNLHIGKEV